MTTHEALKILRNTAWLGTNEDREKTEQAIEVVAEALEQEPKRGKLIAIDDTHDQCMECGAIFCITSSDEWEVNYCPNCGARMESDEE